MAATITEKIFSRRCGREISAGDVMMSPIDAAMIHDITGPLAINKFREMDGTEVFDPSKIIMLFDHQVPADSIPAAENHTFMRDFAAEQDILNYDVHEGVCHQVAVEKGRVRPGDIVVGCDSHTCTYGAIGAFATGIGSTDMGFAMKYGALHFRIPESLLLTTTGTFQDRVGPKDLILRMIGDLTVDGATYKAVEFTGDTISAMTIAGRMTCCNMAIEMGGKAGIVAPDEVTRAYCGGRTDGGWFDLAPDEDAAYVLEREYDAADLAPQIAAPHNVDNVGDVTQFEGIPVNQVFIGSCTNGRYEDLAEAAEVLNGRKFAPDIRVIIVPASRTEYLKALRAGLIETFVEAGGIVEAPSCGPCMGAAYGILAPGEVSLSTSNRNFRGRQGSAEAEVYLCSPATAAASAVTGVITDPREVA